MCIILKMLHDEIVQHFELDARSTFVHMCTCRENVRIVKVVNLKTVKCNFTV